MLALEVLPNAGPQREQFRVAVEYRLMGVLSTCYGPAGWGEMLSVRQAHPLV